MNDVIVLFCILGLAFVDTLTVIRLRKIEKQLRTILEDEP